ncbi:MAG: RtcB family protein [Candidatus Zixiibacteriota bacterium]|nr:MAG: RtcB family protein [candidate division Zixibacteria bacterium]
MAWQGKLKRIDDCRFEIPPDYRSEAMERHGLKMQVPGLIYADDRMIDSITSDNSPDQVAHVATLPGVVGHSFAMPDIHHGYGFAIGGVAAFDAQKGIISPGGVGYDINCGVRLLRSDLHIDDIRPRLSALIDTMFANVPSGVGVGGKIRLTPEQIDQVLLKGAGWAVGEGYGWQSDLEFMEENGCFPGADPSVVMHKARKRGAPQLGSLGAGNHFLEIQYVDEIFDPAVAEVFGIQKVGQVTVMIHTGSRGCGHQICTDNLEMMRRANQKYNIPLVDRELSCAPASSPEGQQYFAAMKCGANFAWANRQMITHWVRQSFEQVLSESAQKMGMSLVYDIAHNIAKLERHQVGGRDTSLFVHRKGATRAFGPGHPDIPESYRAVGQPVIIPGDMGSASYLLAGTERAMIETFGSTCHGAGRLMSRRQATKQFPADKVRQHLRELNIYLKAASRRGVSEEAPGVYKDIDNVVDVSHRSGIARKVARVRPVGVVKG